MLRSLAVVCLVSGFTAPTEAAELKPLFDVEARRAEMGKPAKPSACKAAPSPVRDIRLEGFYSDSNSSIVDPAAYARYQAASKPFNTLTAGLAAMSDAYVRAKPADGAVASCALDWLHGWAAGEGLARRCHESGRLRA